jgi:hypothetical protein
MNPEVSYKLALLNESMRISGEFLLIRLHLKNPTSQELIELEDRATKIRKQIQETKK